MKFKNSSLYVQRQIDNLLRSYRDYVRVYMNNIMIFSKILEKHEKHLHAMFELFDSKEIILSSKKSYLGYLIITLLNQKINAFELIAIANKIVVIKKLNFSYNLIDLKLNLELIDYFRSYIVYYAQKSKALQRRKIVLLQLFSSNKSRMRKIYS